MDEGEKDWEDVGNVAHCENHPLYANEPCTHCSVQAMS